MVLAEDLRQAVLQAALQGKLTKQLEMDSDVDEMLMDIQAEKKKLIAEKKIKKEKPLPEIQEDEFPYNIPDSWRWVRWGNLAYSIQYGYNASAKEMGRIKMVRISDIQDNSVNWDTVPYCDIKDEEIETYLLQKNDILFARTGGTVGKSFLVNEIQEDVIYAGYLIRTRYSNQLVPQYLKGFMESQLYWVQLQNGKTQGCQPNCNGQTLSKMLIPIPPIEEQERIVDKINEIMPKIDEYEKIEKELEALKKEFPTNMKDALLQAAMQGKLTEQLESDSSVDDLLGVIRKEKTQLLKDKKIYKDKKLVEDVENKFEIDMPENWRNVHLQEICTKITDGEHKTPSRVLEYQGYYLLSARNILNGKLVLDDVDYVSKEEYDVISKRCNPHRNDILISCSGSVGRCCLINDDNCYVMVRSAAMIHCLHMNNKYIMYAIQSPYIQAQIDELKKQSVQANLFQSAIASLLVPIPPIEEQQRIVERLEALLPLCEDLKE